MTTAALSSQQLPGSASFSGCTLPQRPYTTNSEDVFAAADTLVNSNSRAEQQLQCNNLPDLNRRTCWDSSQFGRNFCTKAGFGQDFLAMQLPAVYPGYADPPISGWLIILSRCTASGRERDASRLTLIGDALPGVREPAECSNPPLCGRLRYTRQIQTCLLPHPSALLLLDAL